MLNDIEKLKSNIKNNILHISTFNDVDGLLYCYINDACIIFDNVVLKNYFINNTQRNVINCNSSYEKFVDDMELLFNETAIFNNINFCNDFTILNIVDKTNNLKIY